VAPLLAGAFALDDARLGLLGTAFLVVYALAAPPLGALADRRTRTPIVAGGVAFWRVATALTALCRTFPQLFAVRALLGIGEAAYFPPATSLLADAFPQERRARVMAWWGTATPVGVFLGYAVGAAVGQRFGWPYAFLLVGIPGLLLSFFIWRTREPRRGASEGLTVTASHDDGPLGLRLLRIRSLAYTIGAQVFGYFVLGGLSFWLTSYLVRHYHLSAASAGVTAGGLFVVAGGIGTVAGGYLADRLLPLLPSARLLVPALGFLAGGIVIALGLLAPTFPLFLVAYTMAGALVSFYSGPLSALVQDVTPPRSRSRAVALSQLIAHLGGDAFAPSLIGAVSAAFGGAAAGGLDRALWLGPLAAVIAGLVALAGCRYVGADRAAMLNAQPAAAQPVVA
jgi:MFS family permease